MYCTLANVHATYIHWLLHKRIFAPIRLSGPICPFCSALSQCKWFIALIHWYTVYWRTVLKNCGDSLHCNAMMQFNAPQTTTMHYNGPNLWILSAVSFLSHLFGDLVEHLDGVVSTSELPLWLFSFFHEYININCFCSVRIFADNVRKHKLWI